MWAPSLRAFFYCGPLVAHPVGDGFFVALDRASFRHLAAPATRLEDSPEMAGMVPNIEFPADQDRDPFQGPELVGKTASHRPLKQPLLESPPLLGRQLRGTAWHGLRIQSTASLFLPGPCPAVY